MKSPTRVVSGLLWIAAFLVTAASAVYQKTTGPSYPVRDSVHIGNQEIAFELPRSHGGQGDAQIRLHVPDAAVTGTLKFRRFRSHDEWSERPLERDKDTLVAWIPHQPPAGKVMYQLSLTRGGEPPVVLTAKPVVIRFRGELPAWVLVTHVLCIFAGMLLSTRTGFEALRKGRPTFGLTLCAFAFLVIGGLIFGPIVQKHAFGAYWTGWPLGNDLTDNKIAVVVFFWGLALWRSWKKHTARAWVLTAMVVTLAVWLIPHSVLGSELDYTKVPQ